MSFIRPEARDTLWRWREALAGAALALFGLWLGWKGIGGPAILGTILFVAGIALAFAGWQRARFRTGRDGVGVVYVTEGQIAYYGPFLGGTVAAEDIARVTLDKSRGSRWRLAAPGREDLTIPADAEGAEALFDVFAALPGFDTEAMLAALNGPGGGVTVLWQRHTGYLH